jgi:hypothetical protein
VSESDKGERILRRIAEVQEELSQGFLDIAGYPWKEMPEVPDFEAVMEFDREVCASGVKKFLRRADASEQTFLLRTVGSGTMGRCVAVIELEPGARVRVGIG